MTTGQKLKLVRKERGLTQKELSEILSIAESAVRKYESGTIEPKLNTIVQFAKALDINPTKLLPDYFLEAIYDYISKKETEQC